MSIYLGSNKINELYLGSQKIGSIYLGTQKVYSAGGSIPSVKIGNQIWTSKNLAIDDGQGGIYTQTVNYGQGNVVEYYYTWDAAVRVAASVQGWHLPSVAEYETLSSALGADPAAKIKSTYGWNQYNGTDDYGFSAFPAGYDYSGTLYSLNEEAVFWTSTTSGSTKAIYRYLSSGNSMIAYTTLNKTFTRSVRLIKDSE